MNKTEKRAYILLVLIIFGIIALAVVPMEAFARAGGGGGGGKGGGILGIILLPFFAIYSAILTYLVVKKNRQSQILLDTLQSRDKIWDPDNIKSRVEISFFKVQEAWMERDQDIAKDFMSQRLYDKHKIQTDQMIRQRRKNILERINLNESKVVEVADYNDATKDRLWVYLKGSMVDYIVEEDSGSVVSGEKDTLDHFKELWKFIRGPKGWVLDEIDQQAEIKDLIDMHSFSEEMQKK